MRARARVAGACAAAALAACALASSGSAAVKERVSTVATPPAPGPAQYNQVTVHEFGPRSADHVLVLIPGTSGGAGDFTLDGRWLARNVPDLQVWAIDRRENALEDTAMFKEGLAGTKSAQEVFDYYLGWLNGATPPDHYDFLDTSQFGFAREWGMEVALDDVRAVVKRARKQGHDVILGGHSVGASLAISYAAWDFRGRPGYKDLAGTVLIDGGLLGSFDPYNLAQAQEQVALLANDSPFIDLLGIGVPEAAGLFAEVGGLFAKLAPTADGSLLQNFPLLPAEFKPAVPATNRAILGYAFDSDTSPDDLSLLHVHSGCARHLGEPGRLGRRRQHHAGEPDRRHVCAGADQRGRVVLSAQDHDRRQRRRPDADERRRAVPEAAPRAHPRGGPALLRLPDR